MLPDEARTRYASHIAAIRKSIEMQDRQGVSPGKVAAAVEHALFSARPKTRYLVGTDDSGTGPAGPLAARPAARGDHPPVRRAVRQTMATGGSHGGRAQSPQDRQPDCRRGLRVGHAAANAVPPRSATGMLACSSPEPPNCV